MALRGDFTKLRRLHTGLRRLASGTPSRELAARLMVTALHLVDEGFDQERDPYGRAWAALKYRTGAILQLTGRMRAAWTGMLRGAGFILRNSTDYAVHHQYGAPRANVAQRAMMPDETRGVPVRWQVPMRLEAKRWFREVVT